MVLNKLQLAGGRRSYRAILFTQPSALVCLLTRLHLLSLLELFSPSFQAACSSLITHSGHVTALKQYGRPPHAGLCLFARQSRLSRSRLAFQVRNLCYMVTRREKMKHTLCDIQEKIFHLQIQLLEEDIAGGETETNESPDLGFWRC